ncbi:MAG: hypothetical protein MUF31_14435 [Akkermansiaceae bacterium]|nr:hypothetical protein [Akkermansiaceae bacterium]
MAEAQDVTATERDDLIGASSLTATNPRSKPSSSSAPWPSFARRYLRRTRPAPEEPPSGP